MRKALASRIEGVIGKALGPAERRVGHLCQGRTWYEHSAGLCTVHIPVGLLRPKRKDDHVVSKQLSALAELNGVGAVDDAPHLRRVGWLWNHKKVYRIYADEVEYQAQV